MKTITSSRKVLTILNKYGHSISYTVAEELETELAYTVYEENKIIPSNIRINNELCTNVAFDNFDRFVDTFSGKDDVARYLLFQKHFASKSSSEFFF